MKSFKDYLDSLSEEEKDDEKLQDLNDDCDDEEKDDKSEEEKDDELDDDDVNESAQVQLDLLKQIQTKLTQAPLNVLKQVLKRLEAGSDD